MNKELIKGYGFKSSHVLNHDFKHYTKRNSFTFIKKQKITIEKTVKPTIGYFANTFSDEYGISIWEGIKKATQEFGYNLISFVGGSLNNPYFDNTARNAVFDLACNKNVDGILA